MPGPRISEYKQRATRTCRRPRDRRRRFQRPRPLRDCLVCRFVLRWHDGWTCRSPRSTYQDRFWDKRHAQRVFGRRDVRSRDPLDGLEYLHPLCRASRIHARGIAEAAYNSCDRRNPKSASDIAAEFGRKCNAGLSPRIHASGVLCSRRFAIGLGRALVVAGLLGWSLAECWCARSEGWTSCCAKSHWVTCECIPY